MLLEGCRELKLDLETHVVAGSLEDQSWEETLVCKL